MADLEQYQRLHRSILNNRWQAVLKARMHPKLMSIGCMHRVDKGAPHNHPVTGKSAMRSVPAVPGDQPFWGEAVSTARVGTKPISIDRVTTRRLVGALRFMARPEVKQAAVDLGRRMQEEDGAASAVDAFHRHAFHE